MSKPMALVLVAPPGAGKGTQAARLASHYGLARISVGAMLRGHVAASTPIGRRVGEYLTRGDLVPDDMVTEMLRPPILAAMKAGGAVLDGFPRTIRQARQLSELLGDVCHFEAAIRLVVSEAELVRRVLSRGRRGGRADDLRATVMHRLQVFERETAPLMAYFARRGELLEIDGEMPVSEVFSAILGAVNQLRAEHGRAERRGAAEG
jgi:adenylate kinase